MIEKKLAKIRKATLSSMRDFIKEIIVEASNVELESIEHKTELKSIGIDSLGKMEILIDIEMRFNIRIMDDESDWKTVGDIISSVENMEMSK